jgi:TolA-binding protein
MADPTLVAGLASAAATVLSGSFIFIGRKRERSDPNVRQAVSLTKQLMTDQRHDLDRCRRRVSSLERQLEKVRTDMQAEIDQLREELDYAHARIKTLGGP